MKLKSKPKSKFRLGQRVVVRSVRKRDRKAWSEFVSCMEETIGKGWMIKHREYIANKGKPFWVYVLSSGWRYRESWLRKPLKAKKAKEVKKKVERKLVGYGSNSPNWGYALCNELGDSIWKGNWKHDCRDVMIDRLGVSPTEAARVLLALEKTEPETWIEIYKEGK